MIFTIILNFLYTILSNIIGVLPVIEYPAAISSALGTAIGLLKSLDFIFPISTMFQVLTYALIFHLAVLTWKFIHWIYALLRGHRIAK